MLLFVFRQKNKKCLIELCMSSQRGQGPAPPCRYGAACRRPDCYYSHPKPGEMPTLPPLPPPRSADKRPYDGPLDPYAPPGKPKDGPDPRPCRYGMTCRRVECRYTHIPIENLNAKGTVLLFLLSFHSWIVRS
jgi:hypothetical protein